MRLFWVAEIPGPKPSYLGVKEYEWTTAIVPFTDISKALQFSRRVDAEMFESWYRAWRKIPDTETVSIREHGLED